MSQPRRDGVAWINVHGMDEGGGFVTGVTAVPNFVHAARARLPRAVEESA
jgi:hypothetical protein